MRRRKKFKYTSDLPGRLYIYFNTYSEGGAPSFDKFARSIGATLEDLKDLRKHKKFDSAWRECSEIRRDYLIDTALMKRADASLVKFILSSEFGMGEKEVRGGEESLVVTVETVDL